MGARASARAPPPARSLGRAHRPGEARPYRRRRRDAGLRPDEVLDDDQERVLHLLGQVASEAPCGPVLVEAGRPLLGMQGGHVVADLDEADDLPMAAPKRRLGGPEGPQPIGEHVVLGEAHPLAAAEHLPARWACSAGSDGWARRVDRQVRGCGLRPATWEAASFIQTARPSRSVTRIATSASWNSPDGPPSGRRPAVAHRRDRDQPGLPASAAVSRQTQRRAPASSRVASRTSPAPGPAGRPAAGRGPPPRPPSGDPWAAAGSTRGCRLDPTVHHERGRLRIAARRSASMESPGGIGTGGWPAPGPSNCRDTSRGAVRSVFEDRLDSHRWTLPASGRCHRPSGWDRWKMQSRSTSARARSATCETLECPQPTREGYSRSV